MVEGLQSLLPHIAGTIGQIALKLVRAWRNELSDIRTSTALAAPQLTDVALTLHRIGGATREIGVEIFEALLELDAYGAKATLAEIDGRFEIEQTVIRRRITRRERARAINRAS